MPKLKTKRGAAKRFRAKGNGGFKSGHSHMRHILTKKSPKRKRQLGRRSRSTRRGRAGFASSCRTLRETEHGESQTRRHRQARHRKVLDERRATTTRGARSYRAAKQAVIKAGQYAFRDRRVRKREFRALVDNAHQRGPRARNGLSYSRLINGSSCSTEGDGKSWPTSWMDEEGPPRWHRGETQRGIARANDATR